MAPLLSVLDPKLHWEVWSVSKAVYILQEQRLFLATQGQCSLRLAGTNQSCGSLDHNLSESIYFTNTNSYIDHKVNPTLTEFSLIFVTLVFKRNAETETFLCSLPAPRMLFKPFAPNSNDLSPSYPNENKYLQAHLSQFILHDQEKVRKIVSSRRNCRRKRSRSAYTSPSRSLLCSFVWPF